ncbi:unnamed protein product [Urochloa humidicola]
MAAYSPMKIPTCIALMALAAAVLASPCAAQNDPQDFVDLHNQARNDVGLDPVSWDDDVAAFAQSWAAQRAGDCVLQHSGGGPNHYGENLFGGGAGADWSASDAVGLWVSEKQWYDHDSNSCSAPPDKSCGHYTQIVWRDSTTIGCARVVCDNGGVFITCNYNPPGNVDGESPY